MDTAPEEKHYLPKDPLDLPRPEMSLPLPEKELPAHAAPPPAHMDQTHGPFVKTLLAWTAPGRPYRKKRKQFFANIIFITILLEIILFLFSEYILMVLALAILFVIIVLAVVPPHDLHYKITSEGIIIEDHAYLWQELYDFYFKTRNGIPVLHVQTYAMIPGEITITLGDIHSDQIKRILLSFLPFREVVHKSFTEKAANWLSNALELDKTPS